MTNGPGKSDRPTVPEKFPNNAGQPVAEGMEGRGLAKGNLPQPEKMQGAISTRSAFFRAPVFLLCQSEFGNQLQLAISF